MKMNTCTFAKGRTGKTHIIKSYTASLDGVSYYRLFVIHKYINIKWEKKSGPNLPQTHSQAVEGREFYSIEIEFEKCHNQMFM